MAPGNERCSASLPSAEDRTERMRCMTRVDVDVTEEKKQKKKISLQEKKKRREARV
jgi:hypothetical protein